MVMIRIGSHKPALHSKKPTSTWTFHLQTPSVNLGFQTTWEHQDHVESPAQKGLHSEMKILVLAETLAIALNEFNMKRYVLSLWVIMFYLSCLSFLNIFPLVGDRSPEERGRVWYISILICRKPKPWTLEHPAWSSTIRITIVKNRLHTAMWAFWRKNSVSSFWFQKLLLQTYDWR